jgi:hypothetical protein
MGDPERLGSLIEKREQESQKDVVSFLNVYWGVVNILGVWINTFVLTAAVFWAFWIPAGIVGMSAVLYWRLKDVGRSLWHRKFVPQIWVPSLFLLPLFIWLFPVVLHIYPVSWVFSIASGWVALSMYATGVFSKQPSVALGSLAFWASAPFYLVFPARAPWIFTLTNVLGLILPGLVGRHGQRT